MHPRGRVENKTNRNSLAILRKLGQGDALVSKVYPRVRTRGEEAKHEGVGSLCGLGKEK